MLISSLEGFPQEIKVNGLDHSWSYIQMTQQILMRWGIHCSLQEGHIRIDNNNIPPPQTIEIEADWSSSAFFYLVSLISGQSLKFSGLKELSDQGDAIITNLFEGLGVKTLNHNNHTSISKSSITISNHAEFDASEFPDLVPVLISTLVYLKIEATIYGIENLRKKESNRIESINVNINQLSAKLIDNQDGSFQLRIDRETALSNNFNIQTYSDHRIAMAFAPWACQIPNVYIDDWKCTEKSFPNFWSELQKCGYTLVDEI
jgi:3-phosphoshikimate 1-carboxyvinyltransferase